MEVVLDLYSSVHSDDEPLISMDEASVQLQGHLYEAFSAPEAHCLARRLEIYHTPRNGSWLNVAEIELSILSKQCLDRRIPTK